MPQSLTFFRILCSGSRLAGSSCLCLILVYAGIKVYDYDYYGILWLLLISIDINTDIKYNLEALQNPFKVNSVDVTVLLHDSKQPLCVDGMARNSLQASFALRLPPAIGGLSDPVSRPQSISNSSAKDAQERPEVRQKSLQSLNSNEFK